MEISDNGVNLIKSFESCKLTTYFDTGGVRTIGYGHTGKDVYDNQTILQEEADTFLKTDLIEAMESINKYVQVPLQQCQYDALCSFVFNVGTDHFKTSTLLRKINANKMNEAADQFLRWIYDNGKIQAGLLRRRKAERALFLNLDWTQFNFVKGN